MPWDSQFYLTFIYCTVSGVKMTLHRMQITMAARAEGQVGFRYSHIHDMGSPRSEPESGAALQRGLASHNTVFQSCDVQCNFFSFENM